jgi:hypothetical protein
MMDCKSMSTPVIIDLKKLGASDSDLVDPMMYKQLLEYICFVVMDVLV